MILLSFKSINVEGIIIMFMIKRGHGKRLGIYVHIPFCASKCSYCDFYSYVPKSAGVYSKYIDTLIRHMESYKAACADYSPDTVYIGGGTPTVLPPEDFLRLIKAIKHNFHLQKYPEFTVEANPKTVDFETLTRYRRAGVNRLSMGLQSANKAELEALGRIHTPADFEESFRAAREAKITNINIDLMYGIPYQTYRSFMNSLQFTLRLKPEHISIYGLKLEQGTPLAASVASGAYPMPSDEMQFAMYRDAIDILAKNGYVQYEISNFARPGFECRHNIKYWRCDEYLGFGPGAHSYFNGYRFSFKRSISSYMRGVNYVSKEEMTDENEIIPLRERVGEYIMLRMRMTSGVDSREFFRLFGKDFTRTYGKKLERFVPGGYVKVENGVYSFTPAGMFVSNYILSEVLSFNADGTFMLE